MQQTFPPVKYVVPGIIPEGMTLLVAAPKIGKSWMVLGLGLELSNGGHAFGSIAVGKPRPVLYLALEDGQRRLQDRLLKLNKMLSALKATSDAVPGSSLVIVHHTNKGEKGDFLDAVSGTQGIAGAADTVLVLKRDRQDKAATLQVTSRDAEEGEYAMEMNDGSWELKGADLAAAAQAAQTAKQTDGVGDRMADVIEKVGEFPEGIKPQDLAVLMQLDYKSAQVYLSRAYESGRVNRPHRGVYTPVVSVGSVGFSSQNNTTNTNNTPLEGVEP